MPARRAICSEMIRDDPLVLFLGLGATIQIHPVMTPEGLGRGRPWRSSKRPRSTARESGAGAHGSLDLGGRGCYAPAPRIHRSAWKGLSLLKT